MNILLPLVIPPPITTYQFYAFPLSIALVDPQAYIWMYEEYIKIYCDTLNEDNSYVRMRFFLENPDYGYPTLYHSNVGESNRLYFGSDLIEFLRICLRNRYYVYAYVDKFFVPGTPYFHKYHISHDLLIYGCNDEDKQLAIYVYDETKLIQTFVSYDDFTIAYNGRHMQILDKMSPYQSKIVLLKRNHIQMKPDLKKLQTGLRQYLIGEGELKERAVPAKEDGIVRAWGISVYDVLLYAYKNVAQMGHGLEIKDISCFYEHKKMMCQRVRFYQENLRLQANGRVMNDLETIEMAVKKLIYQTVKINRCREENLDISIYLERAVSILEQCRDKEKSALEAYSRQLSDWMDLHGT